MAMSATALATEIKDALVAQGFNPDNNAHVNEWLTNLSTAVANAVVAHLQNNMEIAYGGGHPQFAGDGMHSHPPGDID